jgi:hypothetical protein
MCPMVLLEREEYTKISCICENPQDPRLISCDIYNVNIPKWCPLISTEDLVRITIEETEAMSKMVKEKKGANK